MEETEGVLLSCPNTTMYVDGVLLGTGLLSIREDFITWANEVADTRLLQYPKLSMHAVSRDLTQFPHPCILCLLNLSEDAGDGELEEDPLEEVRFVPEQSSQLQRIYSAIAEGQNLHPDPDDYSSGDELLEETPGDFGLGTNNATEMGDQNYQKIDMTDAMQGVFTCPDDVANLTPKGLELLNKLDGMLTTPKDMVPSSSQQLTPGVVGSLNSGDIVCCQGDVEEGQFDDATPMDAT